MIVIQLTLDSSKQHLLAVHTEGHSPKLISGSDTVEFNGLCTAVSTLEHQLYYSFKKLLPNLELVHQIEPGYFDLNIRQRENFTDLSLAERGEKVEEEKKSWKVLTQSFIIGLRMLEKQYQKELQIKVD